MIASIASATILGARGHPVLVEVHVGQGLPGFTMLGLPDESCREARDRVRAAITSCGIEWPNKKIVVNLAPPQFRKVGSGLDVAVAIGCLVAFDIIPPDAVDGLAFAGELGLDGKIRKVPGIAPMVGVRPEATWVVPADTVNEAAAVGTGTVRGVDHLNGLIAALTRADDWPVVESAAPAQVDEAPTHDLADVKGQQEARLALEVAAAGGHHLLFVGAPGAGKTMLARRLPGLLPDLDAETALQATMVHSAAGIALPPSGLLQRPPFRSPHHTSSVGALVGGGSHQFRPGEISLAHGGVLFLDEMGQFQPKALDGLREAVETGQIMVGRVEQIRVAMPARFQLIGATNPCPCGAGAPVECQCDERVRTRYLSRLSGPFLDRFDLRIAVRRPDVGRMLDGEPGESTASVAERVALARRVAIERAGRLNADLDDVMLHEYAPLTDEAERLLRTELERGRLSGRGYHRVRRVARTLADLAGAGDEAVDEERVAAALLMRTAIGPNAVGAAA
ncbi:MAG: YifB family Mg chelatase-like AAA ATPase [Ilumatobacter sp.]|nr:YifB family Mg chelatase-like AAA ATPase [Ilumatobacter sp.]